MAAIITDQIRILNAKNFVAGVSTSTNSYYAFVGLPSGVECNHVHARLTGRDF